MLQFRCVNPCDTCRNITVVNNMLANVNYAPIIITSAINVTVGNNTIQNALCQNPSIGQGNRYARGPYAATAPISSHSNMQCSVRSKLTYDKGLDTGWVHNHWCRRGVRTLL